MSVLIVPLGRTHQRTGFDCGKPLLNDFLTKFARQYVKRDLARVFVAVDALSPDVLGYYALSSFSVEFQNWPAEDTAGLPQHPVPVVLLGRLAVDRKAQGQKIGAKLLRDAFDRTLKASEQIGVRAILVEAIDDEAAAFYGKFGFRPYRGQPLKLYLRLNEVAAALGSVTRSPGV